MMIQSQWLTGKELVARWGIKDFELINFVQEGLQPFIKGQKRMEPRLPLEVVDIKSEIYITSEEIDKLEKRFNGLKGTPIDIQEWRKITDAQEDAEYPGATTYYSDGSNDRIREQYGNLKSNLRICQEDLATFPDYPWMNYSEREYVCNLDAVTLVLISAYYQCKDVEEIEKTSNKDNSISTIMLSKIQRIPRDEKVAIEIVQTYIAECIKNDETPSIMEGIRLVKKKPELEGYVDKTIRNWTKKQYPAESRKRGRRKSQK